MFLPRPCLIFQRAHLIEKLRHVSQTDALLMS
jgi:hypothetical protein